MGCVFRTPKLRGRTRRSRCCAYSATGTAPPRLGTPKCAGYLRKRGQQGGSYRGVYALCTPCFTLFHVFQEKHYVISRVSGAY